MYCTYALCCAMLCQDDVSGTGDAKSCSLCSQANSLRQIQRSQKPLTSFRIALENNN
jgi:hypothetical protein